jgi:hypothetical protein
MSSSSVSISSLHLATIMVMGAFLPLIARALARRRGNGAQIRASAG